MNANQKGKRFEREIAKRLNKEFDIDCKRTPMSGGMSFKGDIIDLHGVMSSYHIECKHQESLNIWAALRQAEYDRRIGKTPIVVFKKNFTTEYVALKLNDFINMVKEIEEHKI